MPRSRVRSKHAANTLYVFISTHVRACRRENMIIFLFSQSHDIYLYWVRRIPLRRYAEPLSRGAQHSHTSSSAVHECWTLLCTLLTRHWQNSIDTLKSTTYIKYNVMHTWWCIRAHTFRSGEWENWNGRSGYRHRRHLLLTIIDISSHINNVSRLTIVFPIVRRTNKAHKKTRFPDDNAIVGWKYVRFWR